MTVVIYSDMLATPEKLRTGSCRVGTAYAFWRTVKQTGEGEMEKGTMGGRRNRGTGQYYMCGGKSQVTGR